MRHTVGLKCPYDPSAFIPSVLDLNNGSGYLEVITMFAENAIDPHNKS